MLISNQIKPYSPVRKDDTEILETKTKGSRNNSNLRKKVAGKSRHRREEGGWWLGFGGRGDNERIVIKERREGDLVYKTLLVCRFYQI